jgi:hypothetical protein
MMMVGECSPGPSPMQGERMAMMHHAISVVGMFIHTMRAPNSQQDYSDFPRGTIEMTKPESMAYAAALNFLSQEFGSGYRDFIPVQDELQPEGDDPHDREKVEV